MVILLHVHNILETCKQNLGVGGAAPGGEQGAEHGSPLKGTWQ